MAKSKSWSVKGIDGETRDLARDSARAAGMTIGAWIDQAVLKAKHGALPEFAVADAAPMPLADTDADNTSPALTETPAPQPPVPDAPEPAPDTQAEPEPISASMSTPGPAPETGPAPAVDRTQPLTAAPEDRAGMEAFDTGSGTHADDVWTGATSPIAAPRPSAIRYALVGIFFLFLFAGGGWLFVEFSSTERLAPRQIVAERKAPPEATRPEQAKSAPDAAPALRDEVRTGIALAKAGNAKAQHDLGMLHLEGRFVKKDSAEAAKWFERAAVQGLANAQFNLGVLYERGEGVAQNDRLAFFWYQSAAEKGMARAQHNLATAYAEGKGIAKNYPKAVEWFTKSAMAGLGASQYSLAMIYERGLATGTPDLAQARNWYEKAVAQGDAQASERLAAINARLPASKPAKSASTAPPVTTAAATAKQVRRRDIQEIQSLLARMKFDPGPADGQMGRRTADAIRLYQQFAGIKADGVPSLELLEEMRAVAGSMSNGG